MTVRGVTWHLHFTDDYGWRKKKKVRACIFTDDNGLPHKLVRWPYGWADPVEIFGPTREDIIAQAPAIIEEWLDVCEAKDKEESERWVTI